MTMEELLTYIQQHELPEPLIQFVQNHNQKHLCLAGSQHCMYKKRVTDEMLVDIASVLSRVSQDNIIIDLGLNYLTDGCIATLKTLFGQKTIVGLSLRGNKLTAAAGDDLFELLHTSQLKYLSLAENDLKKATEDVCRAIYLGSALHFGITSQNVQTTPQKLGTLQYLDLSSTGFTEGANVYLSKFLRSRFCGLRDLLLDTPSFNRDSHGINGFHRLSEALKYNCTLRGLRIRHCSLLDDEALCSIIDSLDASVATQNLFEELMNDLAKAGQQRVHERVGQMQKLQQRQLRAVGFPEPLQARAVTPLVYLDVSGCESLCFDSCIRISKHLAKQDGCYLRTLVFDGVKVKNKGISALAESLVKYAPVKPQEDPGDGTMSGPDLTYEVFGGLIIPESADGYGVAYKNITKQTLIKEYAPDIESIQLSFRRSQIDGQGLCALALLSKLNKLVSYVAIQGNDLVVQNGETCNTEVIWHPAVEWELAFAVREQTGAPVRCDFGLERAAQERGRLQFYKREPKLLASTWVFE